MCCVTVILDKEEVKEFVHLVVYPVAAVSARSASGWPVSAAGSLAPSAAEHTINCHIKQQAAITMNKSCSLGYFC